MSTAVAGAGTVLGVIVLYLLRGYWRLAERVARLEGITEARRDRNP